jgi:hypothetical protein
MTRGRYLHRLDLSTDQTPGSNILVVDVHFSMHEQVFFARILA